MSRHWGGIPHRREDMLTSALTFWHKTQKLEGEAPLLLREWGFCLPVATGWGLLNGRGDSPLRMTFPSGRVSKGGRLGTLAPNPFILGFHPKPCPRVEPEGHSISMDWPSVSRIGLGGHFDGQRSQAVCEHILTTLTLRCGIPPKQPDSPAVPFYG